MGEVVGFTCVRCGKRFPGEVGPWVFEGCPDCAREGRPANLSTEYGPVAHAPGELRALFRSRPKTMWRYLEFLPASSQDEVVSLLEGGTPLIRLPYLEKECGVRRFFVKDESRNPTGSYKDRLASSALTHARRWGAKVVCVSSTGNHGASTAAYASVAGLECVVLTLESVPLTMKVLMQVYGGKLLACKSSRDRWKLVAWAVRERGWYPTGNFIDPPIGSNPFGVDGYKSIAFEICEDLGWDVPDVVIQPTAYADGLYGIWKGFVDLRRAGLIGTLPRMYAAEALGVLERALASGGTLEEIPFSPSQAFSITTPLGTYQGLKALMDSGGGAVTVSDQEMLAVQKSLGRKGLFAEMSSCASVAAAIALARKGVLSNSDTVVAILTATGQRDPWVTGSVMPAVPVIGPEVGEMLRCLKEVYGFCA